MWYSESFADVLKESSKVENVKPGESINYKVRYQLDDPLKKYSMQNDDHDKSIFEVVKRLKTNDKSLEDCVVNYQHNCFDLNDANQPITKGDKIENLRNKSINGKINISFISNDWNLMFGSIKDEISQLRRETSQLRQENIKLSQSLLFPILIREMIKKLKEKIFKALNFESINQINYKSNCDNLKKLINVRSERLKIIKEFSIGELEQLFFEDEYITHLNQVAHPDLSQFKQELIKSIEFYNDKLNIKLFDYLFQGKI